MFTDDIGVQNWLVREKVCADMAWGGISLDKNRNRNASSDKIAGLNTTKSKVKIISVPNDEEQVICMEGLRLIGEIA